MLSEISQAQKDKYCTSHSIVEVKNGFQSINEQKRLSRMGEKK
jgi:hypothetical protein